MSPASTKEASDFYKCFALAVLTLNYVLGELGHFLVGVTSKEIAIDLHYGDVACQFNSTTLSVIDLPIQCDSANSSETCESLKLNGTQYCEWNYNGLGLDYQVLAGPSFSAVYTTGGVIFGIAADRFNRVRLLTICTIALGAALFFTGTVTKYWQLVVFRMLTAAGEACCTPLSAGLLSDWFSDEKRALSMSLFNFGFFAGYGIAFPLGRYVSQTNLLGMGWRLCFYGPGLVAVFIALFIGLTLKEPERKIIGEEKQNIQKKESFLEILFEPRMILLMIAASIRNCGGYCIAYNCDLFYRKYYPDYNLSWWLFAVTSVVGSVGVVVGGAVSDKFVAKWGVKSRVFMLGVSQFLASPFSFGAMYLEPTLAMISLAFSYFFAEMWIGILFATMVEIVPLRVRSKTVGIFLFVMNNIGGILPILVDPVGKLIGYRESMYIFFAGFFFLSSIMFLITTLAMDGPKRRIESSKKDCTVNEIKTSMSDLSKFSPATPSANQDSRL